jgi:hypothetical protein
MWAKLESITRREAYLESPFPVSGRGDTVAKPNGLSLAALAISAPLSASAEIAIAPAVDESGARPLPGVAASGEARAARPSNVLPLRRDPARRKQRPRRVAI